MTTSRGEFEDCFAIGATTDLAYWRVFRTSQRRRRSTLDIESFLDKLEDVHPAGTGYVGICPAHDDRQASLGVTEGDEGLLITCHAGCTTESVLQAMGLQWRDLFFNAVNYAEPEAIYGYTDEQGNVLFEAVRFPGKKFRQRHRDPESGEWVWNLDGVRRVVYGLPEVIAAVAAGTTIYICEGEKDAEALRALGKVATCNPMGAGKWRDEYTQFFVGAAVIIVADRDEPGRAHAEQVKQSLQGVARDIWVVQARSGKDAADHLAAGHAVEQFMPLRQPVRRGIITAREMADQALEDLELTAVDLPGYVLVDAVPVVFRQGRMYALGAYTGGGKTRYALQGARSLATQGRRGGYFSLELPERDLRNGLLTHRGIPLSLLEEPWRLKMDPVMRELYLDGVEEIASWNLDIIFESGVTAQRIAEIARDREYEFVIVDHIHRFAWGDRRKLEEQVVALTNIALEQNLMLLVLSQLRKYQRGKDFEVYPRPTKDDFRETSQIADDASMALAIWRQRDGSGVRYTGATEVIVLKNRHTTGRHDEEGTVFMPGFDTLSQTFTRGASHGSVVEVRPGESGGATDSASALSPWT